MSLKHIVIIDSGIGALTIYQALVRRNYNCHYSIISDSAFYPYGKMDIKQLTQRLYKLFARIQYKLQPEAIILACNTATTHVVEDLRRQVPSVIIGVVPAIKTASQLSQSSGFTVLCTELTATSPYLKQLIASFGNNLPSYVKGCKELADAAENYMLCGRELNPELRANLAQFFEQNRECKVCVLGCTHYALLIPQLQKIAPHITHWIDTGEAIANRVGDILQLSLSEQNQGYDFYETGNKYRGGHFLRQLNALSLNYRRW